MASEGDSRDDVRKSSAADDGIRLITEDLFHDILNQQFGKCTIKKFTVANSTITGENFACSMYRVTIDFQMEGMSRRYHFHCLIPASYITFRWNRQFS